MSKRSTTLYRRNTEVSFEFSAERVSSNEAIVLLDKLERNYKLISRISNHIQGQQNVPSPSTPLKNSCSNISSSLCRSSKIAMDVELLKNYPLFEDIQQLKEVLKAPASHLQ